VFPLLETPVTGWPWHGLYVQKTLPANGEEVSVVVLDHPEKNYTARMVAIDKTRWFYNCEIISSE
jgi:hypothetical protein